MMLRAATCLLGRLHRPRAGRVNQGRGAAVRIGRRCAAESVVMRTELGFWSVLVGTVGVTGIAKVKALQTCLKQALTCWMSLQLPCFGRYPAQARSVTGRLADGEREHGTGGGPHVGRYHRLQSG